MIWSGEGHPTKAAQLSNHYLDYEFDSIRYRCRGQRLVAWSRSTDKGQRAYPNYHLSVGLAHTRSLTETILQDIVQR